MSRSEVLGSCVSAMILEWNGRRGRDIVLRVSHQRFASLSSAPTRSENSHRHDFYDQLTWQRRRNEENQLFAPWVCSPSPLFRSAGLFARSPCILYFTATLCSYHFFTMRTTLSALFFVAFACVTGQYIPGRYSSSLYLIPLYSLRQYMLLPSPVPIPPHALLLERQRFRLRLLRPYRRLPRWLSAHQGYVHPFILSS